MVFTPIPYTIGCITWPLARGKRLVVACKTTWSNPPGFSKALSVTLCDDIINEVAHIPGQLTHLIWNDEQLCVYLITEKSTTHH